MLKAIIILTIISLGLHWLIKKGYFKIWPNHTGYKKPTNRQLHARTAPRRTDGTFARKVHVTKHGKRTGYFYL